MQDVAMSQILKYFKIIAVLRQLTIYNFINSQFKLQSIRLVQCYSTATNKKLQQQHIYGKTFN